MSNHVINPNYFDDAVEEFSFDYVWWHVTGQIVDEYGNQKNTFTRLPLRGSLQPHSYSRSLNKEGMTEVRTYSFYCKSIYRIDSGDFINYQNDWLIVKGVEPYDEYGVRTVELESANPAMYRDLMEAIKALTGEYVP